MELVKNNIIKNEESTIKQLLDKIVPYWPVFIILSILGLGAAFVYIKLTTPLYEATATMIIKDEKKGNDDSKLMESLNMINSKKIIENEIEVLQSRTLMNDVVIKLKLYAPISQKGNIRDISAYTISPIAIESKSPDKIKSVRNVKFNYNKRDRSIAIENKKMGNLNEWINTPFGTIKFIPNENYIPSNEIKQLSFSLYPPKEIINIILRNLKVVAASKLSSVINLSYKDEVPQKAENILNELLLFYDISSINEKNNLAKNTLKFVEERLFSVSKDLDSIERNVQQYKTIGNASDIGVEGQLYLQNVSSNDQKLGEINMQLAVLTEIDQIVKSNNKNKKTVMPSTLGVTDPTLSKLIIDLNSKELEYDKLKMTVAENNPILFSLKDQINKIKPSISENIVSQQKNLEASKNNINNTNNQYSSVLSSIPQKERKILEMSRDENIKKGIYAFLLEKREESELSYASTISDSRIVNKAESSKYPVSPNKPIIYLVSIFVTCILSFLLVNAKDFLSNKILYRDEIRSMTTIPVIGEISYNKKENRSGIDKRKRNITSEEIRKINVSLKSLLLENTKKILVTSSITGEGKSFIAFQLAKSNALSGKKVVLVDMDIHDSGLNKILKEFNKKTGINGYLNGDALIDEIIEKIPGYDNFYFIPSGVNKESDKELFDEEKLKLLKEYLEDTFEWIIIDSAPINLFSDAYIISKICDTTIFIVRHDCTPKSFIKRIDDNIKATPLGNPVIIFNGLKRKGIGSSKYGYGYQYVNGVNKGVYI